MFKRPERQITRQWGQRVRAARETRGMTAAQLATLVGRDRTTIYRLENGTVNPPVEQWLRIANALGISASELFDGNDVVVRSA